MAAHGGGRRKSVEFEKNGDENGENSREAGGMTVVLRRGCEREQQKPRRGFGKVRKLFVIFKIRYFILF